MQKIDHADIIVTHVCNRRCQFCIDKFVHTSNEQVSLDDVSKFLDLVRKNTNDEIEVLLLGGEPTTLPAEKLKNIATLIRSKGFKPIMSTNGVLKRKIIEILPYYDWIQVTVHNDEEIDYYRKYGDKINIKLSGDENLTMDNLKHFIEYTEGFARRSVSMYFTPDFKELCTDSAIWEMLDTLKWSRNGSYLYAFYKNVRFKKCIHGETNIINEDSVPKLYPNGNYNRTWNNEELDDYLKH